MKYSLITLLVVLGLVTLGAPLVVAQSSDNLRDYVRERLEATDELITRASEAVRGCNDPLAGGPLRNAVKYQERAWEAFERNAYKVADGLTVKAREMAMRALSRCRQTEQAESVVLRRLERAGEYLDRARDQMIQQDGEGLRTMLESARDNLAKAWEFYRGGQYRPALRLADQVEKAAERLVTVARLSERHEARFERRRENAERLIEQARGMLDGCDSETARECLDQAREALNLALDLQIQNQNKAALAALKKAREQALKVGRECQGADQLQQRYERLKKETDRTAEQLRQSDDNSRRQTGLELVNQAFEQLELARKHLSEEKTKQASASLQAARLALRQAQRYITGSN